MIFTQCLPRPLKRTEPSAPIFFKCLYPFSTISREISSCQFIHPDPLANIGTLQTPGGITADSPDQPLPLKAFHCQVLLDQESDYSDPLKKIRFTKAMRIHGLHQQFSLMSLILPNNVLWNIKFIFLNRVRFIY